jgi:nucleoside-diphosphate-sugar epimerase
MTASPKLTVLVTGAAGGIGRYVVTDLLAHGHDVVALDQVTTRIPGAVRQIVGDTTDRDVVRRAMEGVDALAHLAAIPHPHGEADEVFTANSRSAYLVLDEAGRAGVTRAAVASSLAALGFAWSVHPRSPDYAPIDEAHPLQVEDPYGLSKVVLEQACHAAHRRWGIHVVALRFPFVGTGERLDVQRSRIQNDAAAGRNELWAWMDTRDAAVAVRLGLTTGYAGSHVVNTVAPDTLALQPTEELLARHHPATELRARLPGHATPFSMQRARELLGFTATHTWRPGAG